MRYTEEEEKGIAHLNTLREDPLFEKLFQAYVARQRFREPEIETALFHLSYFVEGGYYIGQMLTTMVRPLDLEILIKVFEMDTPLHEVIQQRLIAQGVLLPDGSLNPHCKPYIERMLNLRSMFKGLPQNIAEEILESMVFSASDNEAHQHEEDGDDS